MRAFFPALMAIAALFVIGAAIVWSNGDAEFDIFAPSSSAVSTPSSVAALLGKNATAATGDMVYLNDVLIRTGPRPNLFVISGAGNQRMLVVSDLPNSFAGRAPLTVDIRGLIRPLPSQIVLRKAWKLNEEQVHVFGKEQIYIVAESVKEQIARED